MTENNQTEGSGVITVPDGTRLYKSAYNSEQIERAWAKIISGELEDLEQNVMGASETVLRALDNVPPGATPVVNDLTTGGTAVALSAEQGKVLSTKVEQAILTASDDATVKANAAEAAAKSASIKNPSGISDGQTILKGSGNTVTAGPWPCNRNLLDNWCFINPVNQRGVASGEPWGNHTVGIDRWNAFSGGTTYWSSAGYVVVSPAGNNILEQKMDEERVAQFVGREMTVSALFDDGELVFGTFVWPQAGERVDRYFTYQGQVARIQSGTTNNGYPAVRFWGHNQVEYHIVAMKLEYGFGQTIAHKKNGVLALNEVPDYGEELAKCQRYFQVFRDQSNRPTYGKDFRPVMVTNTPTLSTITVGGVTYYTASSDP